MRKAMEFPRRRKNPGTGRRDGDAREAQEGVRARFGIGALADDEELVDDALFHSIQDRMDAARTAVALGESTSTTGPHGRPTQEILLEELAPASGKETTRESEPLQAAPASPVQALTLETKLLEAPDRETVAALALRLARRHATTVVLMSVQRGMIGGIRAEVDGALRPAAGLMLSQGSDSLLAECAAEGRAIREADTPRPLDARVHRALGQPDPADRLVIPVKIRGRVACLLYADNGPHRLPETSIAALAALGHCIGAAFERLIVSRKQTSASAR